MDWSYTKLWNKAQLYINLAVAAPRDSPLFGISAIIALEFLARCVLAKVHPALLADTRIENSVLYACELTEDNPKSLDSRYVFERCLCIVKNLTTDDLKQMKLFLELRNEELHSGGLPFVRFPPGSWLAEYYRITQKLLTHLSISLDDYLGKDEARAASSLLATASRHLIADVSKTVAARKTLFDALDPEERKNRSNVANAIEPKWGTTKVTCPACSSACIVSGQEIGRSPARFDDDGDIVQDATFLPIGLMCEACELELTSYEELQVAKLGKTFVRAVWTSPLDYYEKDIRAYYFSDDGYH